MFYLPTLNVGGAERVTVNILRHLDKSKYEIHLVVGWRVGELLSLIPKDVIFHDLKVVRTIHAIWNLRKIIQKVEPLVVYSTLIRTHIALNIALIGKHSHVKTLMRMPTSPKLMLQNKMINSFWRYGLERALKNATMVLAQTPEMKTEIYEYHKISQHKIEIVLNLLDRKFIDASIKNISNPFEKKMVNVVASGSIQHLKGFDILILAFKEVYQADKSFRLFILGSDYQKKQIEYEKLIDELNLNEVIFFLGHKNNPYQYYFYSDLFVLSSRHEGLPNVVLENLYLKKPVIATNCIPFMHTIIKDGDNGLLVEVEDVESLTQSILNYKNIKNPRLIIDNQYVSIDEVFDNICI
jgi:glycosyltransferase involved in cell wall biosynthesis